MDDSLISKEEEEVASADISSYSYMQRRKDEEKRFAERLNTHREYSYMKATTYSKECEMCFEDELTWRCLDCRRGGLDLCSICMGSGNYNLRHRFECISEAPPPCDEALSNGMKTFRAMRDERNTGDLKHESEEFNFHLTQCPVCQFGKRALRMNYDGCFKLRQMKTAEKVDAPPIGRRSPYRVL